MDKIVEFINRRFSKDCEWTNGNCLWFAMLLCKRFPNLKVFYEPVRGHFVAGNGKVFYDWNGYVDFKDTSKLLLLDTIKDEDTLWYTHLMRDCFD